MEIVIYFIFFFAWFLFNYKSHGFNGGTFVIFLYLSSIVCAGYMISFSSMFDAGKLDFFAVVSHVLFLFLFLFPFIYATNHHKLIDLTKTTLNFLFYMVFVFSVFSYLAYLPKVISVFQYGSLGEARVAFYMGTLNAEDVGGISAYIGIVGRTISLVSLYLFFYFIAKSESKIKVSILFFCSFVDVFVSLSYAGRGGITRWIFMMVFYYFLFNDYLSPVIKNKIKTALTISILPMVVIFLVVSYSRFSGREFSVIEFILGYFGQPFIYFSYIFYDFFDNTYSGQQVFPLFGVPAEGLYSDKLNGIDYYINTFSTFVGSIYKDVGFLITLLIAMFFSIVTIVTYRVERLSTKLYRLIYFVIIANIFVNGLFYFQFSSSTLLKGFLLLLVLGYFLPFFIEFFATDKKFKRN